MSSDHAGHLGYSRLDLEHPAYDPGELETSCSRSTRRSTPPAAC